MALTAKTVGEAHLRTCLYTTDEIVDAMRKPQDARRIAYFKGLVSLKDQSNRFPVIFIFFSFHQFLASRRTMARMCK